MRYLGIVLVVCAFLSLGAGNRIESVVYNITPAWGTGTNAVTQIGGTEVKLATKLAPGTTVLFEDLMPGANWRHPALYRVVDKNGKVLEEIKTDLPPRDLAKATVVKGSVPAWGNVKIELNDFKGAHRVSNPQNHYAILINGHADQRHWNDFAFLYKTLTQVYGFNQDNIIVADGVNKTSQGDLDGDGDDDIKYSSTLEGLKAAMADLRDRVTADDEVILAVNDHGSQLGGESTIVLYDTEIKASDFKKLFNEVKAKKVISIYEQCFSGGFVRPTTGYARVAMAAATNNEYSWATKDLLFDEFIYHVIAGFAMQTHRGTPVNSDTNKDGKISAQEAFAYAVAMDEAAESPIMESNKNSGDAAQYGLGF